MMEDVAALRETVAIQAEEIALLRRELSLQPSLERVTLAVRVFGITLSQAQILVALCSGRLMSRDALYDAYTGHRCDDRDIKIVDVFVSKMRPALKAKDVEIETIWGLGYRLSAASKVRLHALLRIDEPTR